MHVAKPVQKANGAWRCANKLTGLASQDGVFESAGFEPFQAIMMAMERIRHVFEMQEEEYFYKNVEVRTILPLFAPISYGVEFQDEIEAMIQKRVDEEEKRLTDKFSKKYPERYKGVLDKNDEDKEGSS